MDGKSVPCVHRRSSRCLAWSIKINLLRNALGRYVLSFSKVKYPCGSDCSPAVVALYFSFVFFFLQKKKRIGICIMYSTMYGVCPWDNHYDVCCSQMEQYASRKSGKESLGARAPLRMALAWCQNLVHTLTREEVRSTSPTGNNVWSSMTGKFQPFIGRSRSRDKTRDLRPQKKGKNGMVNGFGDFNGCERGPW